MPSLFLLQRGLRFPLVIYVIAVFVKFGFKRFAQSVNLVEDCRVILSFCRVGQ